MPTLGDAHAYTLSPTHFLTCSLAQVMSRWYSLVAQALPRANEADSEGSREASNSRHGGCDEASDKAVVARSRHLGNHVCFPACLCLCVLRYRSSPASCTSAPVPTQNGLSECRRERWCACSLPHAMGSQAAGGKGVRGVHAGKCGSGLCMLASVVVACGVCGVPLREAVRHVESLRVCLVAIRCMLQGQTSVHCYWAGALLRTLACHVPSVG